MTDYAEIDIGRVNLCDLAFIVVRRADPDRADIAQARQLADELDVEIGSLRIILATLEARRRSVAVRHRISAARQDLAALLMFRHRLGDRFGA